MPSGVVRLTVTLKASPSGAPELLTALRYLMRGTRVEAGCLGCSVWADSNSGVHYQEEWATEADARRHVRSAGFTSLLAVMESAQGPPEVRFEFVTTTRGLDYVAEVRQGHHRSGS